jgi:hypothetical protein
MMYVQVRQECKQHKNGKPLMGQGSVHAVGCNGKQPLEM